MTFLTVFALFGDDLRIAFCDPSLDIMFFSVSVIALVLFLFELCIQIVGKKVRTG